MNVGSEAIDVPGFHDDVVAPRTRGRPARISRERIIAAARTIAPETLTMQKVADVLGVDPKALNYHVGDRDGLRQLVVSGASRRIVERCSRATSAKLPGHGEKCWEKRISWFTGKPNNDLQVERGMPRSSHGVALP
jgi:AcrR family transcriptional regulator